MPEIKPWTDDEALVARWRPLTADEKARTTGIIAMVERALRRRWPDLQQRIDADTLDIQTVQDVVYALARPLIETDPDVPLAAKSWQETSGSESLSVTLDGALSGRFLVLDPWMVDALNADTDDDDSRSSRTPTYAAPDPGDWWDRTFPSNPEGTY